MILKSLSYTSRSFNSTIYAAYDMEVRIFLSSHIARATLGYISLNVKKDFGATFGKKNKRGKSEKREGEKRTSVILGEKGLPP
jgi:hypothetical protein